MPKEGESTNNPRLKCSCGWHGNEDELVPKYVRDLRGDVTPEPACPRCRNVFLEEDSDVRVSIQDRKCVIVRYPSGRVVRYAYSRLYSEEQMLLPERRANEN